MPSVLAPPVRIVTKSNGRYLHLILAFTTTAFTDVGAYLVGSAFKGKKLCPEISPNKTIEGCIIGSLVSTFVCTVYYVNVINIQKSIITVILV